ncbi:hypothetical protein SASPL_139317 [Salvia splendens]|uniref:Uncharacterized protein n=1 Tax=Salvia splendens TaxID=180675 RepID=A0A8X8WMX8_SALSN|nr:hypothetical protein SASPL_139317 [Salvia splendens]
MTRCYGHAEPVWANLSHPRMQGQSYGYGGYRDSYGPLDYPTRMIRDYSYTPNNINYDYEYDRRLRTYDITMDAEKSQATIVGQVDPNFCLKAITRCNGHAEIVWANLSHPRARGQSYGYGGYRDSYHPLDYPTRSLPHYSYTPNNINYDYNYDRRRRTDPYGVDTIPYYNEESMNHCIIL